MGGESLLGRKTGIGQYSENLARNLMQFSEIEDLKFLAHGKLIPSKALIETSRKKGEQNKSNSAISNVIAKARGIIAKNSAAVRCYESMIPFLERRALRQYSGEDIFHSPNYLLPDFRGKRVVTILDLSTIKHPEFHNPSIARLVNRYIHKAVRSADHLIAISNFVKQEIITEFGVPENRISTTYLSANSSFLPLTRPEFLSSNVYKDIDYKNYFICTSTIEPRKNLSRLLDAYALYRRRAKSHALPLVIAGHPGWGNKEFHRRIRQVEASTGVIYLGYVRQDHLPTLIAGARALLYPSLYEGFGLPVIEAMQSGTAVLTSKDSAMSEIAGGAALLTNPYDIEQMASNLFELASDDSLTQKCQEYGILRSAEFGWQFCANQTLSIYKRLLR